MAPESIFLQIQEWGSKFIPEVARIPVRRVYIPLRRLSNALAIRHVKPININDVARKEIRFLILYSDRFEVLLEAPFILGLLENVYLTESIDGDIIELGSFRGGSTVMIAQLLKKIGSSKKIFACDTFEGFPYDDNHSNPPRRKHQFSGTSAKYVLNKFQRLNVDDKITIVKGVFEETLVLNFANKRFSLAFVDCDLYESTKYVLEFLYPRINGGGRIVLHDYNDTKWGLTKAIDEWCKKNGLRVNLNSVPYIEKPESKSTRN